MRISINEGYFRKKPDGRNTVERQKEAVSLIAKAGFDAVDFGLFGISPNSCLSMTENYIDKAKEVREYCDSLGIAVNQTHAPFYEGKPMPDGYMEAMLRTVEASAALGADCVVVHADNWNEEGVEFEYSRALDAIYEVYAPVVELAEKVGVNIAMETLFCWNPEWRRFCSRREELDDIISRFGTDNVGVCLDTGHWRVAYGAAMTDEIRKLKSKIIATHIHDNKGKTDDHMFPFTATANWDSICAALRDVGYNGDVTLELVYGSFPDELALDAAAFARRIGEHLRNRIKGE